MFNPDQIANLLQYLFTTGFAMLAAHGYLTSTSATLWAGVLGSAATFWISHHSNASTPPTSPAPSAPAKSPTVPPVALMAILALSSLLLAGCVSSGQNKVTAGIWNNGFGWKQTTSTATNGFNFHFPIALTNALPILMDAGF